MDFQIVDYSEYNKPPFLPGWMNKEQTLELAKTPDKQLEDLCIVTKHLSEQFAPEFFINNTELLNKRGRLLGIERQGSDNETYYKQQELRILLNLNKSTIPDIIKILKTFYSAEVIHIRPNYPAGITILHDGLSPVGVDFNSLIAETIGAGIAFETRELYVYKEKLNIYPDKITLKFWNLDEIHYCGQISYNGVATYGGQHWEDMLYDGSSRYNGRDEYNLDGIKRIRTEFFNIKDNYVLVYVPKDEETGYLVLGDYNLKHKQTHKNYEEINILKDEQFIRFRLGDVDYSGKIFYNDAVTYGTNKTEPNKLKFKDKGYLLKEKYNSEDVLNSSDVNYSLKEQFTNKEDEAGMTDIVNLQHLYYSYFDGTESYDEAIVYGPKINSIYT